MLSFEIPVHILSGHKNKKLPQHNHKSKEGVLRLLRLKGSLTVEAALVLPIFVLSMISLFSLLFQLRLMIRIQDALYEEGMYLCEIACNQNLNELDVSEEILRALENGNDGGLHQESGINAYTRDGIRIEEAYQYNQELVNLSAVYEGKLLYDFQNLFQKTFHQGVIMHTFTGYVNGLSGRGYDAKEVYVYVTEDSEVYHRSRECSHIRLTIREVSGKDIKSLRNDEGNKYKACRHCHAKIGSAVLYVTAEGDCYHSSLSCSGLSRSVKQIPISQVGGRRPCMRCGY